MTACQVLADNSMLKDLIEEATRQGYRRALTAAAAWQGPVLQYLAMMAMSARLDSPPSCAEWYSMYPWPAVICVDRFLTCWEQELLRPSHDAPARNAALVVPKKRQPPHARADNRDGHSVRQWQDLRSPLWPPLYDSQSAGSKVFPTGGLALGRTHEAMHGLAEAHCPQGVGLTHAWFKRTWPVPTAPSSRARAPGTRVYTST